MARLARSAPADTPFCDGEHCVHSMKPSALRTDVSRCGSQSPLGGDRVARWRVGAAEQFADFGFAGTAIGAGLEAPADGVDGGTTFADFRRYLMAPDAKAGADDRADVLAPPVWLSGKQRTPRRRR